MPTLNRFSKIRRISLLFAILIGFACGPGAEEMGEFFSLFQPEAATYPAADSRYLFTPQLYNDGLFGTDDLPDSVAADANVQVWVRYLGSGFSARTIRNALADTSDANELIQQLDRTNPAAATYLRFAYASQRAAGETGVWGGAEKDSVALLTAIETAEKGVSESKEPFLTERYAFQVVRMAAEAGQFEQGKTAYEQLVVPLKAKTFISGWARCRYAGTLLALGEKDRAVYEFAQVFANVPTRRLAAERSIRHAGLRFTEAALAFAKTDAERVAVYAICAIQPKQDALPLLEKMAELDPKNPLNELVLAREINRNEYYFAAKRFPGYVDNEQTRADSVAFERRKKDVPDYSQRLLAFTSTAATNTALGNSAFYQTATAYLHYLAGDYTSAKKTLDAAAQQPTANAVLKQQIALQQMLILAAQPGLPDATAETNLLSYLTMFRQGNVPGKDPDVAGANFRFTNALQTVGKQLAARYVGNDGGDRTGKWLGLIGCTNKTPYEGDQSTYVGPRQAKAYLMRMLTTGYSADNEPYAFYDFDAQMALDDSTSLQMAQNLAYYIANPINEFDEKLVKLIGVDADYAHQLVGRRAMSEGKYDVAAKAFGKLKPGTLQSAALRNNFAIDPFSVNMPGDTKPRNPYSPAQFAQRMYDVQITTMFSKNAAEKAQAWYDLGCGAFNLTHSGNAWILVRRFRSSAEPYTYRFNATETAQLDRFWRDPYYTAKTAQSYFAQAAKEADSPEFAAKATWMAVRCEAIAFETRRTVEVAKMGGYVADDDEAFEARMRKLAATDSYDTYFRTYQIRYRQTEFARQMETRCALYSDFMAGE